MTPEPGATPIGPLANPRIRAALWIVAAGFVVLLGFSLRAPHYRAGSHPDEVIAIEVVRYMRQSGVWDTNWARADLDPVFRYDQYNFSSYNYGLFYFYRLAKLIPGLEAWRSADGGFAVYRFFSVLISTIVVWQGIMLGRRLGSRLAAVAAGALVAVVPLLVQDARYIRPEAFVTMLTLAAVALAVPEGRWAAARLLGAAFLIGLLVACKVSMVLLAWIPLVPLVSRWRELPRPWVVLILVPAAGFAGFAAGVPGALVHPEVFIHGVRFLADHYANAHPPHSHFPIGPVADLMSRYFLAMLGWPCVLLALLGMTSLVVRRKWPVLILLAGPVLIFAAYFARQTVFFERNLSHIVPLVLVLAALGLVESCRWIARHRPALVIPAAAALLAVLAMRPASVTRHLLAEYSGAAGRAADAEHAALRARHPEAEWWVSMLLESSPLNQLAARFSRDPKPVLACILDFGDDWTAAHVPQLLQRFEATPVGGRTSPFAEFPVCTLHTYHRPNERYFLITGVRANDASAGGQGSNATRNP